MIPAGIEITVDKQTKIVVTGPNREQVGQVAAKIRGFRPPEPYLGKGIKYADEHIRRKAGKSAAK
jgi:large subunit ribosomal protein L6